MEVSTQRLYLYNDVRRLLFRGDRFTSYTMDNAPMNKRPLKLHKGTDNELVFRVFNPDRTPANICQYNVFVRVIDIDTHEMLFEKEAKPGAQTGFLQVQVPEVDLIDIMPGQYKIAFVAQRQSLHNTPGYTNTKPLYTDFDHNADMTVEVVDQVFREPVPSVTVTSTDWTEVRVSDAEYGNRVSTFQTSTIPGARSRTPINNLHTFSVTTDNYTGKLEIYGTLDLTANPSLDQGWFKVELPDAEFLRFISYTGTRYFNFEGNYMWVRFVHTPSVEVDDAGTFTKLIVRS